MSVANFGHFGDYENTSALSQGDWLGDGQRWAEGTLESQTKFDGKQGPEARMLKAYWTRYSERNEEGVLIPIKLKLDTRSTQVSCSEFQFCIATPVHHSQRQ